MNNKEFIAELARRSGLTNNEVQRMVNTLIGTLGDVFQRGDSVQLANFGTFEVKKKMERVMVSPGTGQRILVPPKLTLAFKPTSVQRDSIKKKGGQANG